jgi:protein tyrosine/serine phosphatase
MIAYCAFSLQVDHSRERDLSLREVIVIRPSGISLFFARRTFLRLMAYFFAASVLSLGLYLAILQLSGNFHPVIAGELYRSAQPSPERIAAYQRQFGIKTIINLRGGKHGKAWYDDEVATAARLGIAHIDYRMSSSRELTQRKATDLLAILKTADKPILIHCQGGADRSGLVAALYVARIAQKGEDAAEEQISIRYGHVGIPFLSSAFAMDSTWENLEKWLGFHNS